MKDTNSEKDETVHISFFQLLKSTWAAFIGVQSNENRERDFKHGKLSSFVAIGLLSALLFIGLIIAVVQIVIYVAGS